MTTPTEAIGAPEDGDWRLQPLTHAERMLPEAEPLRRLLRGSAVQVIVDQYEAGNSEAMRYQAAYKVLGHWEIYLSAATAVIGAFVLYLSSGGSEWLDPLRVILLPVQAFCLAGAVAFKYRLGQGRYYRHWQQQRTRAESARIELFETVCGIEADPGDEDGGRGLPLLALQLEYFLRYQLRVQLNFYRERGRQHARAAHRFASVGSVITFVAALAATLAGVGADLGDWVGAVAVLGLVAPVLLGAQTSLSRLEQNERNAERYALTHAQLQNLQKQVDAVRAAATAGNRDVVRRFIDAVNGLISVEHREWIADQEQGAGQGGLAPSNDGRDGRSR